jgi:hypothetical protein
MNRLHNEICVRTAQGESCHVEATIIHRAGDRHALMLVRFGPPLLFSQAKSQARPCHYRYDRIAAWSAARVASAPVLTRSLNEAGTLKFETFAHACARARTSNPVGLDRKTVRFAIDIRSLCWEKANWPSATWKGPFQIRPLLLQDLRSKLFGEGV